MTLSNQRLFGFAVLLSLVPIWVGQRLPMVDLPQHAGQIVAMRELWAGNELFTQWFQINWFTPYLLGYMLLYLLSLVMPVSAATQVLVSAAVVSVPLLTASLLRSAGADERWRWLAIPASYGFGFYWGFLSFIVATPVALLFLMHAIRYSRTPSLRGALLTALFSIFLFFCHIIVLCFASLVALGYVVGCHHRSFKQLLLHMLPFTAPLPLMALWFTIIQTNEASAAMPTVWGYGWIRLVQLLTQPTGWDSFTPFYTVVAASAVALLPALAGSTLSRRPERCLPFALGVLAFVTLPAVIMNTAFVYQRLGIFLTPLWLLVWDAPKREPKFKLELLAIPFVVLWAGMNIGRFAAFAREGDSFDTVMSAAEPGRRVANMPLEYSTPLFAAPVHLHYAAWYQTTHRGIVDFNFADFYSQTVRYRPDAGGRISENLAWEPRWFEWARDGGDAYDYFAVRSRVDISDDIFKDHRSAVELVAHSGAWWLYRNTARFNGPAPASASTPASR